MDLLDTNMANQSISFLPALLMPLPIQIPIPFPQPFPNILRPFQGPIPIIPTAAHWFEMAGFSSGFVKQSVII
jgi:hypothetical protein